MLEDVKRSDSYKIKNKVILKIGDLIYFYRTNKYGCIESIYKSGGRWKASYIRFDNSTTKGSFYICYIHEIAKVINA